MRGSGLRVELVVRLLELGAHVVGGDVELLVGCRGDVEHGVDHHRLHNGAQTAGAELVLYRLDRKSVV